MTTDFFLLRWKSEGLRCPDHEIKLLESGDDPHGVTLIQMPNGTGKTTTLSLLRATLSGDAVEWPNRYLQSFRKRQSSAASGRFLVEGVFDGKRLTIVLELDFEEGKASYSTTVGNGKKIGFHPPRGLHRFLNRDFVRLFVFDGEEAARLLDHQYTNAHDAIDNLFQLKFFDGIEQHIRDYWAEQTSQATASAEKGLTQRRNRVVQLQAQLNECEAAYVVAKGARDQAQEQHKKKKRKFEQQLKKQSDYQEALLASETALTDAKTQVQQQAQKLHIQIRDPFALSAKTASDLMTLRANLDKVKLPESTAREFFDELAREEECVCGRPLTDDCKAHILSQASRYLGADDVALLNSMKSDIAAMVGANPAAHAAELQSATRQLLENIRAEDVARTKRDAVRLKAVADDPALKKIVDEIADLRSRAEKAGADVAKYENTDEAEDNVCGIPVLKRRLNEAERKLAEITQTLSLKEKRDVLVSIVQSAQKLARTAISEQTVKEANERIQALMPKNRVRIRAIDKCLVLEEQEGGSMGETLSVAYAFLATFFNGADNRFPFVVDSPAGAIDLEIRSRIAQLVPRLTSQFIAFTISSERQGFCDQFLTKRSGTRYYTLFRKGDEAFDRQARAIKGNVETDDGLLVPGAKFFQNFQLESE